MKQGKVWGETIALLSTPMCELHRITIKAGSRCSMHRHVHKSNAFYVLEGKLRIVVEKQDYDLVDATDLGPGEFTTVSPGEYHRFEALTDVVALEIYYPQPLAPDIERRDCGNAAG